MYWFEPDASIVESVTFGCSRSKEISKEFTDVGMHFIKYAEQDFMSIEGKTEEEQQEIIHTAYQKLREKDNEIRNNLKLIDTRLSDIVMPIKSFM